MAPAQCSTEADLAFLLAPEMFIAHRYQDIGGLPTQPLAEEIGSSGTGYAIVETGIGDAARQRNIGKDRDDRNAMTLQVTDNLRNLGNVTRLQEDSVTSSSRDRMERFHDFGGLHRLLQQKARADYCRMQGRKFGIECAPDFVTESPGSLYDHIDDELPPGRREV